MDRDTTTQRLWQAFCKKYHNSVQCAQTRSQATKWKHPLYKNLLQMLSPIKTVHAGEQDENKTKTSIENLSERRPVILVTDEEVREYLKNETGKDRLRCLFSKGDDGRQHPDLLAMSFIIQCSAGLVFVGTSVFGAKAAREAFLTKQHRVYKTKFRAQRAYNDALMIGAFKFGGTWALKTMLFTGLFLCTSQSIATYRNKTSVLEYFAGGALTGAILRLNLGLRGFIAGGIIGSVIGGIGGIMFYLTLTMSGETQEQRHYWRIQEKLRQKKEIELLTNKKPSDTVASSTKQGSEPLPT